MYELLTIKTKIIHSFHWSKLIKSEYSGSKKVVTHLKRKSKQKKKDRIQPTWKAPISPARIELAISSATIKQEVIQPASANHTIFDIHSVTLHGIVIFRIYANFSCYLLLKIIQVQFLFGLLGSQKLRNKLIEIWDFRFGGAEGLVVWIWKKGTDILVVTS